MRFKIVHSLFLFAGVVMFNGCSSDNAGTKITSKSENRPTDSIYDVFLVAGQSNAYYGTGLDTAIDKGYPGLYQLGRSEPFNMKIIPASEPMHHYFPKPNRIGFAMTFAKLYDSFTDFKKNILIIPCAMDWTGLTDSSWRRGDCLYNDAVYRANYVFNKYPKSTLKAFLWQQGERDAGSKVFQQLLDSMIAGFRKDITGANSKTPFILGGMVPFWVEQDGERGRIQEIIKTTPNRMPNTAYVNPSEPFRISKEKDTEDMYHYNAAGQRELGKRYFEEYRKLLESHK